MAKTITKVLSFGEAVSESGALILAEIDAEKNLDDDGNVKSSFLPETEVFVIIHHDPEIKIVKVRDTGEGDLQRIGEVTRSHSEEITFTHAADKHELTHIPNSLPVASWYGRESVLSLDGRQIQAATCPCLGEVAYEFDAIQYKYRLPTSVTLGVGEQFPVDLVVEYETA